MANNFFLKVGGAALNASVQTTSFNTDAVKLEYSNGYSVSAVFTGTTTGTIKLQASNDSGESQAPGNFVDIPGSTFDLVAGSPFIWNVTGAQYTWVRATHTDTGGGDLTITARLTQKG